jgi:hypothetical protein
MVFWLTQSMGVKGKTFTPVFRRDLILAQSGNQESFGSEKLYSTAKHGGSMLIHRIEETTMAFSP